MVSMAIGLVVIAWAGVAMAELVRSAARTLLVMRVDHDLRIAADLMAGELRRAGFWQDAGRALMPAPAPASAATAASTAMATAAVPAGSAPATGGARPRNPYQAISVSPGGELRYSQSRDAENDLVDGNEAFGFRLHGSAIEYLLGGSGWQALTDASVVAVTRLSIAPSSSVQWLDVCAAACSPGAAGAAGAPGAPGAAGAAGAAAAGLPVCPSLTLRRFDLSVQAYAVADPLVVREIALTVKVRNDALEGGC